MMDTLHLDRSLKKLMDTATEELGKTCEKLNYAYFEKAVSLILDAEARGRRIHITGIGKPHHVANYLASLMSSTGTPAYFLDGTEATHGSAGQVERGDVVILISYYGDVDQLNKTLMTLKNNGAKTVAMTGFDDSYIAMNSDVHLNCYVSAEGDEMNRAPRTSMLVTLFIGMALTLVLQDVKGLTLQEYLSYHPSGKLGQDMIESGDANEKENREN